MKGLLFIAGLFLCIECCAQLSNEYDLSSPDKLIKLPKKVDEISGLAYNNNFVYAIDDDHGDLFKISLDEDPEIQSWHFGKDKDYEDVVLANGIIYVLNSHGAVLLFPEKFPVRKVTEAKLDKKGKKELESLYFDPSINKIVMLCKRCGFDHKKENSAWVLNNAATGFNKTPLYTLHKKDIEEVRGKKIGKFKPSAATINPVTGELYIISSINKLVVMKKEKIVAAIPFKRKLFEQPEGICFTPSGTMLVSNEAGHKDNATILIFERH